MNAAGWLRRDVMLWGSLLASASAARQTAVLSRCSYRDVTASFLLCELLGIYCRVVN